MPRDERGGNSLFGNIIVGYDEERQGEDTRALATYLADSLGAKIVDPGPVSARTLAEIAEGDDAGLVVVGSSPRARPKTTLPDTVGADLLAAPSRPVAIAPLGFGQRSEPRIHQLGIAYDGSPGAEAALALGTKLAEAAGARLEVLAVAEPPFEGLATNGGRNGNGAAERSPSSPRTQLELAVTGALRRVPREIASSEESVYGIPTRTLLSRSAGLDLMVLGSRWDGKPGQPLGRVSSGLLLGGAGCPLLVAPLVTSSSPA